MIYRIVQYIQPWEIDDLERQIHTNILGSYYINNPKDIIWTVVMNTDIVNWENSGIKMSYFENKLNYLRGLVNNYFTADFKIDNNIKGAASLRRSCENKDQDYVIWLDSDIYFSKFTLPLLIASTKSINTEVFMISPEIIKYWDNSWDCLVHEKFLNEPYNHRDTFDLYSIDDIVSKNDIRLSINDTIKFGAGWFSLFSSAMIKKLHLPEKLGDYGPDDTYYSLCGNKLNIPQYVLRGVFVSEIGNKYLNNKDYIKNELDIIIKDKQKISDSDFYTLIKNFYESN